MSKILILSHDAKFRGLCTDQIRKKGHEAARFNIDDHVLQHVADEAPDLIVLDAFQIDNCTDILKDFPADRGKKVPIVVVLGVLNAEEERCLFEAGAIDVVGRDLMPEKIIAKVIHILKNGPKVLKLDPAKLKNERILIVDDEDSILKLLGDYFGSRGFQIQTAKDGQEALDCIRQDRPNVVLMDLRMPGMDGFTALKKIRESDPDLGVIIITGLIDEKAAKETIRDLGAYAYVTKPFDIRYLELVVTTRLVLAS